MATIEGLNKKQTFLADLLWKMDTEQEVMTFINSLPPNDRKDAQVVLQMMILSLIDEVETCDDAKELLSKF